MGPDHRRRKMIANKSWHRAALALLTVCFFGWSQPSAADPALSHLFTDHMVLQRDREIHIWGNANPAEKIAVMLAGHGKTTTADKSGRWSVQLPSMQAGGPFTLFIRGKKEIMVRDVMIGEVWIASGQSNMAFALSGAETAEAEIPKAEYPLIRLFTVPQRVATTPIDDTPYARWQICSPETAKNFSAVAYFFARDIHKSLNVPVGIIASAWSGSSIEDWINPDVLAENSAAKASFDKWNQQIPAGESIAAEPRPVEMEFDDFELIPATGPARESLANFDDGTSRLSTGGSFSYTWDSTPQAAFELTAPGRGGSGFAARLSGKLDGTQTSMLVAHYKADNSAADLSTYAGIRFWQRGNGALRFRSLQSDIYDWDDYATTLPKPTPEWKQVTVLFRDLKQDGWGIVMPFSPTSLTGFTLENTTASGHIPAAGLYHGMITPVLPYPLRGAIWYQGESNALTAYEYRALLPTMIDGWRKAWHNEQMNFFIVQLPNHGGTPDRPGDSAWAELREAQLQTMKKVSHTGLAVTIDVGDPGNVHPHRKLEVGQRLALWALGTTYKKPIVYSGPIFSSMKIDGNAARIRFDHTGGGLEVRGQQLEGFAIADSDRKFHWAQASIDGDSVVVSSTEVANPAAVRYAWGDSPKCNLFNKDGLPASPFRTDDWPGITQH